MEALKFPNPVENGPVRRRIEVRFADNVHEGSVVVTKERDEPPTSERNRNIELVTQLPEVFPPPIRCQVAQAIVVFQKNVRA
jgi:hypothetical protein